MKKKECKHDFRLLDKRYDTSTVVFVNGYKFYCTKCLLVVEKGNR